MLARQRPEPSQQTHGKTDASDHRDGGKTVIRVQLGKAAGLSKETRLAHRLMWRASMKISRYGHAVLTLLTLLAGAAQSASAQTSGHTYDATNQSGAAVLRDILTRAGTIDGKRIIGFQMTTRCTTAVATSGKTFLIDWHGVGNFAGHSEGGRESFAISDGKGVHVISVPAGVHPEPLGNAGARVDGGFSVIADSCEH